MQINIYIYKCLLQRYVEFKMFYSCKNNTNYELFIIKNPYDIEEILTFDLINTKRNIFYYNNGIEQKFNNNSFIEYRFFDDHISYCKCYAKGYISYKYRFYNNYTTNIIIHKLIIKYYIYAYSQLDKTYSYSCKYITGKKYLLGITNFRIVNYI